VIIDLTQWVSPEQASVELFLLRPEHVTADYVAWLNDPEINQFLESRFERHTIDSTIAFVEGVLDSPDSLLLGIRSRSSGRHVGNIKVGPVNWRHETGDVGILVGDRSAWGKGIATDAIKAMTGIARDLLSLRKVTAGCYASNLGSKRAFEKAGYTIEGIRPRQLLLNGQPEDLVLMGKSFR
jgi:ribosomal-protein-alanine N-acetyltransferase